MEPFQYELLCRVLTNKPFKFDLFPRVFTMKPFQYDLPSRMFIMKQDSEEICIRDIHDDNRGYIINIPENIFEEMIKDYINEKTKNIHNCGIEDIKTDGDHSKWWYRFCPYCGVDFMEKILGSKK